MTPLDIDVAGATAALAAAGGQDAIPTPAPTDPWVRDPAGRFAPNTPADAPTPAVTDPPAADSTTPPAGTDELPDFTSIDDGALSPELLQMKRSLQADYTRKMQEAAPWRKLGQELGIEQPEDFRSAAEVYQRLQDPRNWPTITGELTEYMQQYGMSPAQANQAAADQLAQFAPDTDPDPSEFDDGSGPDPATLQLLKQLSAEVQALKGTITQRDQQAQQQAEWHATASRLTQAEAQIRAANPHYNDQVIEAIYALTGQDGDLNAAQLRYESLIGAQVAQYIGSKESAVTTAPAPVPGGGVLSGEPPVKLTPEQAHAAAMAHVARLDRQDATS